MKTIIFAIICLTCWGSIASAQVAVIANKSVPMDNIKKSQLLDFYTKDIKFWSNGKTVVLFDLKPKEQVRNEFYEFLGKTSSAMKLIWMRKMLSGEGRPPESLKTEEEMLKKVVSTPGAIGFVRQSKINIEVKTLLVIKEEGK